MKPNETLNTLLKRMYRIDPGRAGKPRSAHGMGESHGASEGLVMTILASSGYLVLVAVLGFSGAVKLRHPRAFATAI